MGTCLRPAYLRSQYYHKVRSIYVTRHWLPSLLGQVQSWEIQSGGDVSCLTILAPGPRECWCLLCVQYVTTVWMTTFRQAKSDEHTLNEWCYRATTNVSCPWGVCKKDRRLRSRCTAHEVDGSHYLSITRIYYLQSTILRDLQILIHFIFMIIL